MWHYDIALYMQNNNIVNLKQARIEKWEGLKDFAISHQFVKGYKASYLKGRNSAALQEDLNILLIDIRPKDTKKRKIATVEDTVRGAMGQDPVEEEEAAANER